LLGLAAAFAAQQAREPRIDADSAAAAFRLRLLEPKTMRDCILQRLKNAQLFGLEVDGRPGEAKNLTPPRTGCGRNGNDREQAGSFETMQELVKLVTVERADLLLACRSRPRARHSWRSGVIARIS
jgi:hypothetical protein